MTDADLRLHAAGTHRRGGGAALDAHSSSAQTPLAVEFARPDQQRPEPARSDLDGLLTHQLPGERCDRSPIAVSSGDQRRRRLSRAGNRSLNQRAAPRARVQTMHAAPGQDLYRKQGEHKTPAEALRSLKRQLTKIVYRQLRADHAVRAIPSPELT